MRLVGSIAIDHFIKDSDHVVLCNVGDRSTTPPGDELTPKLSFDNRGFAGFANMPLDEVLGNRSKGIFLLPLFS